MKPGWTRPGGRGTARSGGASRDLAGFGKAGGERHDTARLGTVRCGPMRRGTAGMASLGKTLIGAARHGERFI